MNNSPKPRIPVPDSEFNELYKVPIRTAGNADNLLDSNFGPAVGWLQIPNGPALQFYARLIPSKRLRVIFHGAVNLERDSYPHFDRVSTSLRQDESFVSFADPTLCAGDDLTLCWYAGTEFWDPAPLLREVISTAIEKTAATDVVFIGGSGGGFAALRFSAEFPGSKAFVFSPQTSAVKYRGSHFPLLLEKAYGGRSIERAYEEFPGRFTVLERYAEPFENSVFYLQNLNDPSHIASHYNPLRRRLGVEEAVGVDPSGRFRFELYDSEQEGHGPPTANEFKVYFDRAEDWWSAVSPVANNHAEALATNTVDDQESSFSSIESKLAELLSYAQRSHRALQRELGKVPFEVETYRRLASNFPEDALSLPPAGSFALRTDGAKELVELVASLRPKTVVECGSGASTAWIARTLIDNRRGKLFSLENEEEYLQHTKRLLGRLGVGSVVDLIRAPIEDIGDGQKWYSLAALSWLPKFIDILLVDGPAAQTGRFARKPAVERLFDRLKPGSVVLVDDALRPDEAEMVTAWLRDYPLSELNEFGTFRAFEVVEEAGL